MLLDALERGDTDIAKSVSVVQVERRRRWIERLRAGARRTHDGGPPDAARHGARKREEPMDFGENHGHVKRERLEAFMDVHIYPNEARFFRESMELGPWAVWPVVEELKPLAARPGCGTCSCPTPATVPG